MQGGLPSPGWLDYGQYRGGAAHTVTGSVKVMPAVSAPQLDDRRDILVYLPPSYDRTGRRYPVLYMHDGQNLFDETTSYAGEWRVDETLAELSREDIECIVVGIPNAGERRYDEYTPFQDEQGGGGQGDVYLAFLVDVVKPLVERSFRIAAGREGTGIAGSSLGGLISLYGFLRYPQVFGRAGVFSPAFEAGTAAFFRYVEGVAFSGGKIYMDVGTLEGRGLEPDPDAMQEVSDLYRTDVQRMCRVLEAKGYRAGHDLLCVEDEGAVHHESAWARRLPAALRFLLTG